MKLDPKFVGIPFKSGGRDFTGADCWGVAVLYYKHQLGIDLPSFADEYHADDTERLRELIARHREGWQRVTVPSVGDLVLFKLLGTETHIGVCLGNGKFLHATQKSASAVQDLNGTEYSRRVVGYFKYREQTGVAGVSVVPSALSTQAVRCEVAAGTTVSTIVEEAAVAAGVSAETIAEKLVVLLNGRILPREVWSLTELNSDDLLEYRVVAGKDVLKIVILVAIAVIAPQFLAGAGMFAAGGAFAGAGLALTGTQLALATVAVNVAASLLVNAIFPVRPPAQPQDPGQAERQLLISGGQNAAQKYNAIPVILGRVRITPPLAANTYSRTETDQAYLRMLVCWGFGHLAVSDVRIGGTSIDQFNLGTPGHSHYAGSPYDTAETLANTISVYGSPRGSDIEQKYYGIKLASDGTLSEITSPWTEYTFNQEITSAEIDFHFPQGLRQIVAQGKNAGTINPAEFRGVIQYRQVGSTSWNSTNTRYLTSAYPYDFTAPTLTTTVWTSGIDGGASTTTLYLYQWYSVGLATNGQIVILAGTPSQSQTAEANANTLSYLQASNYNVATSRPKLKPELPTDVAPLFRVCVISVPQYSSDESNYFIGIATQKVAEESIKDLTKYSYSGLSVSWGSGASAYLGTSSNRVNIAAGAVSLVGSSVEFVELGTAQFVRRKDAFSYTVPISLPAKARYEFRVRRLNSDSAGTDALVNYHDSYLSTITGFNPGVPIIEPKNCKLALSAFNILATDQLNGQIEGINGLVCTIALDYAPQVGTWYLNQTNNPASLFRYILEHPANAQRIREENISTQLNLAELQDWHVYCAEKSFTYNGVLAQQRSILDVLRDVCAAGRASPIMRDGKWTVVVDRERQYPVQFFTPHNSWGFESVKNLPKLPDAFRVIFPNEVKGYQEDEIQVFNVGKSALNSELYEELNLPGITNSQLAFTHARWHLAQLRLRPETYTFNTDMEYLVCTRGDLVRVAHDVPLWGTSTGRIASRVSATELELSEESPLEVGINYVVRIRLADGSSTLKTLAPVLESGYYTTIVLSTSVTELEGAVDNLYMLGIQEQETQELVVLSIEPQANYTARLTLTDYSPSIYTVDEFADYPIPDFNTNITLPAKNLVKSILEVPVIQQILSDESVLDRLAPGVFRTNLVATAVVDVQLTDGIAGIEFQAKLKIDGLNTSSGAWNLNTKVLFPATIGKFSEVIEGQIYELRARYLGADGRTGPFTEIYEHFVIGKTSKPASVSGLTANLLTADSLLQLSWSANGEADLELYEIRTTDTNWGLDGYTWRGYTSQVDLPVLASGTPVTYYIRAKDYSNNYSETSAMYTLTVQAPEPVTNLAYKYSSSNTTAQTSTTNSTVTITWNAAQRSINGLDVKEYLITIDRPDIAENEIVSVQGTTYTARADWLGDAELTIVTKDVKNNSSIPALLYITKQKPDSVTLANAEVVDNNVFLSWTLPAPTSLPVSNVLIKRGPTWETPDRIIGEKDGTFTSILELAGGQYTYWIASIDTDGRESTPVAVPATVSQPPDFVFNAEYTGNFTGVNTTLVNSFVAVNTNELTMLVNTTETWAQHFTTPDPDWATPNSQIAAGYPFYPQPGITTASYREVFNYEQVLASSSVTISYTGYNLSGNPTVSTSIETSLDGVSWSTPVVASSIFATNFQYIRITITATRTAVGDIHVLQAVSVRLDSKQKSDSGKGVTASSDTLGTIVNFSEDKEFIDVTSITVTPSGTTPLMASYNHLDSVLTGTYVVSGGVGTVTVASHSLETGQRVRLAFSTGVATSGVYPITKVSASQYTVNLTGTPNTSGNVSTYPQSMRVYVFDNVGTRQSVPFGWSLKGY